jgi:predicted nucleic-acid-binding protein
MTAIDTNVVVRFLEDDDLEQSRAVLNLLTKQRVLYRIDDIALLETWWVLIRIYEWTELEVVEGFEGLLSIYNLAFEDEKRLRLCLKAVKTGADFADELIFRRNQSAGCDKIATFDKGFAKRHPGYAYIPKIEN